MSAPLPVAEASRVPDSARGEWILTTAVIVCVAIALRLALNFSSTYPPGTDAAYYPMQTLYWFAHGRLMYADLPLLFWMNIAFTRVLTLAGQPLDGAALLASRILDSVLQPCTAVVLMMAGYSWSDRRRTGLIVAAVAALLATVSGPVLRLLSDFEKNSLGLLWMAAAIWACRSVMRAPTRRNLAALVVCLVLSALTHVGTFAVTTIAVGLSILLWLGRGTGRHLVRALVSAAALTALLVGILYVFDAHRALSIVRGPSIIFLKGPRQFPAPPAIVLVLAVVFFAMRRAHRDRDRIPESDTALVLGLSATLVILVLPKQLEYFDRLQLMAPVPAAFLILFVLARRVVSGRSLLPTYFIALLLLIPTAYPSLHRGALINERAAADMREVKRQIADPVRTLVVAPHGLEWWAGYFLGTLVATQRPAEGDDRYDRVLLLRHTEPIGPLPGPMSPMPSLPLPARLIYEGKAIEVYDSGE